MKSKARTNHQTGGFDFYPTPPWATRCLFEHVLLPLRLFDKEDVIWEPACGQGHMSSVLNEYGSTKATDLIEYGGPTGGDPTGWVGTVNFLDPLATGKIAKSVDWIITNPPFAMGTEFVLAALGFSHVDVALLVPSMWIASPPRYNNIFSTQPPTIVAQYVDRIPFSKGALDPDGPSMIDFCWLIWIRNRPAQTSLVWIPPGQKALLSKSADAIMFKTKEAAQVHVQLTDPFGFKKDTQPAPKKRRVKVKS